MAENEQVKKKAEEEVISTTLNLKIITPAETIFDEEITYITAPGEYGDIGVLSGHEKLLANLRIGKLEIVQQNNEMIYFAVNKGFIEILNDEITVLTDTAEKAEEIDIERAESALKRAEQRLSDKAEEEEIDKIRAQDALLRAKTRISVAKIIEPY